MASAPYSALHQRSGGSSGASIPPSDSRLLISMPSLAADERRGPAPRRSWRWRDVFAGITAFSVLWIALLHTALVVGVAIGGLELKATVQRHVDAARPYVDAVLPHVTRHSGTADALFEAATSPEALALVERGHAVARRTLTLAEMFYATRPEETLPLAAARAAAWEARLESLYNDRRTALLARFVEQGAELAETRTGGIFSDIIEISNITRVFIQRQARRMRALEAALAE